MDSEEAFTRAPLLYSHSPWKVAFTGRHFVVRLDTYKAGAFLVWQLKHAGAVIHEDGGDIIHLSLPTGEAISIHIIESSIPAYEIKNIIKNNQASGLYTLFILWADMLLPPEGHVVEVEEWEWPLLALYGEKLWAYDIFGGELFIYPIHYDRIGPYREIRYGKTVNMRQLQGTVVEVDTPFIRGRWRVASFSDKTPHKRRYATDTDGQKSPRSTQPDSYAEFYAVLGISLDSEVEDVKTAYRNLARKIHPDVNKAPDATAQMQALNEAYRRLMATFEEE